MKFLINQNRPFFSKLQPTVDWMEPAACPIALQLCVGTPEKFRLHLAVVYAVGKVA